MYFLQITKYWPCVPLVLVPDFSLSVWPGPDTRVEAPIFLLHGVFEAHDYFLAFLF
jgi:hypothetical protein